MISLEVRYYLNDIARQLDSAKHGQRGEIIIQAEQFLGLPVQTVYRYLKTYCGWSSKRKARADKGQTTVPNQSLLALGTASRESVRDNGKQTLFTTTARGMLEHNGYKFGVTNAHLNRLMRARKLNVASQKVTNVVQPLRAPHPNHTHEIDPSLCLIYYLKNRQYIMRDSEFYKNKLENYAKVKYKVWRYTLYDRASGMIIPWYVEAAGENQYALFDFLMFAWRKQNNRLFHGVPFNLYWDKGSANTSSTIKSLLRNLEVNFFEHERGNARAKGGVENANNIIETQFESRLRFEPVKDIAQLNQSAKAWAEAYNSNRVPGQDTRLRRAGLSEPTSRHALWQLISTQQLRLLPSIEICKALMLSKEQERQVKADLSITFKHPQSNNSLVYSLKGLDGVAVKDRVLVRALVYGDCAIQIEVPRYNGEMLTYRIEPERGYDQFGQLLSAAVIGQEYKSHADTSIEQASKAMDEVAYPNLSEKEIKKARSKQIVPFDGKLKAHSYLDDVEHPSYFSKKGESIGISKYLTQLAITTLSVTATALKITRELGRPLSLDENKYLSLKYKDGVPEEKVEELISFFKNGKIPLLKVV